MNPLPHKGRTSHGVKRNGSRCAGQRTRVLIADNHHTFAERCRGILESEFEVVGIAWDGSEAVRLAVEFEPDVLVMDMAMPPGMNGFEAAERLKAIRPKTKVIFMTVAADFELVAEGLRRGAAGFVDKGRFPEELLVAVRWAVRGDVRLSASLLAH